MSKHNNDLIEIQELNILEIVLNIVLLWLLLLVSYVRAMLHILTFLPLIIEGIYFIVAVPVGNPAELLSIE